MCSISARSLLMGSHCGRRGQSRLQLQTGQRRSEVVADGGEERGALLDLTLDTFLHVQERLAGLAHLSRAIGLETVSTPLPKASAAVASRSMARTWLRMNRIATAVSTQVATVSQAMRCARARRRPARAGAMMRSTPPATSPGCRGRRDSGWCRRRTAGYLAVHGRAQAAVEAWEEGAVVHRRQAGARAEARWRYSASSRLLIVMDAVPSSPARGAAGPERWPTCGGPSSASTAWS